MSRYIDAEWLIKESMPLSFSVQKWVNEVQIMTAPSIDIVRCKECKSRGFYLEDADMYICNACDQLAFEPMHFCSYGEREGE